MTERLAASGEAAEAYVASRLRRAGYQILDRNWRARGGELDIVALDGQTLVFVEVKARTSRRDNVADDALDPRQLDRLMIAAERYIDSHREHEDRVWRIDFVAITLGPDGVVRRLQRYENVTLD